MTGTQGNRAATLGLAGALALLAGCTATTPPPVSSSRPVRAATAPVATAPGVTAPAATAPACGTAPKALVERAGVSVAAHPGPVTATTYVFAATTETGNWYVLGLDRTFVRDDGTPGLGPEGDQSRSLALTNAARTTDGEVAMIPLSVDVSDRTPVSWDRVSWTGATLAAGRRAVERAIACLDAQRLT